MVPFFVSCTVLFLLLFTSPEIFGVISDRMFSLKNELSGSVRVEQSISLLNSWYENPVLGRGFGSHADFVRSEKAPYSYEMVFFAMLMKQGLLGVSMWNILFSALIFKVIKVEVMATSKGWSIYWLATLGSFFLTLMTNPYLFNFVGMFAILMLVLEVDYRQHLVYCRL
jgi:hypothetical protein